MPGSDRCPLLHHYLRRAAGYWPNASAIVEEERVVTFRELWERAGALASFLRGRGLAPGDRVAILLPKSVEAITAMFASLTLPAMAACTARRPNGRGTSVRFASSWARPTVAPASGASWRERSSMWRGRPV